MFQENSMPVTAMMPVSNRQNQADAVGGQVIANAERTESTKGR